MSETRVALMALLVWLGASMAVPVPLPLLVVALLVAAVHGNPWRLVAAALVLSSWSGARANDDYVMAIERLGAEHRVESVEATLVTDPEVGPFGGRVEARMHDTGDRVRLDLGFDLLGRLGNAGAGHHVMVRGVIRPLDPTPWLRSRHLVGDMSVSSLDVVAGPAWYLQPSELLRGAVRGGSARLRSGDAEALYLGLVIGDDRRQSVSQQAEFRMVGLSHLLAVSGQNVVFVMAVAAPVLRRLDTGPRLVATVAVLVVFALATRLEPSVLRATVTAGLSALAVAHGSRAVGVRALSLAVVLLVLVDPLLTDSIGFILSVTASLGILVISPALARRLHGPQAVADALAITLGAQLGVAPVLLTTFGPVSLASVPANLLAGWAAGVVMMLGLTVGIVSGVVPEWAGEVLQLPASALLDWIDGVAGVAAAAPFPRLRWNGFIAVAGIVVAAWLGGAARPVRLLAAIAVVPVATAVLAVSVPHPPSTETSLHGGGYWYPGGTHGGAVLVVHSGADGRLVESVVERRIRTVDAVVVEGGGSRAATVVAELLRIVDVEVVLAPPQHRVVGATRVVGEARLVLGDGSVLAVSGDHTSLATHRLRNERSGRFGQPDRPPDG